MSRAQAKIFQDKSKKTEIDPEFANASIKGFFVY